MNMGSTSPSSISGHGQVDPVKLNVWKMNKIRPMRRPLERSHLLPGVALTISFASGRDRCLLRTIGLVAPNSNGLVQLNDTGTLPLRTEGRLMRKLIIASMLIIASLPLAAGTKDEGKTTLRDVQPAGTTEKNHKHLQYDLSFSTPTSKDYTCRTKENEKPKATEMVVGSDITYEIKGNKGKVKLANGKDLDCTVVRVANTPVATPPPADAPGATKPNP